MFRFIKGIFGFFWKIISWTRIAILNLFFIAIVVLIFQAIKSAPVLQTPEKSALYLAPSGTLVDQRTYNPSAIDLFTGAQNRPQETNIHDLTKAIRLARDDFQITGLVIRLDYMTGASISKIEEIGQAINYFKESGKRVVAFADSMNQQQYLLATYADEVYINNMGSVYLTGFGVYRSYYKSAAEKLALKFHVFRVGEYKDAIEPFIRDDMSTASKEHIGTWLRSLWDRYAGIIETHRDLQPGSLDILIRKLDSDLKNIKGDAAKYAVEQNLVDASLSRVALKKRLIEYFGENKDDNVNTIGLYPYLNNPTLHIEVENSDKIGLIVATGNILDGEQPENAIGADSLSRLIRKAREDDDISALVVRVDSGGGSAFASEVIRDQLRLTKDSGMPVYISMGSVAASGGYWISTPATEIWSTPTTLTGSIGVFGLIPNISDSLNKLGIYSDGIGTSDLSDAFNIDRELSPRAKIIIQSSVENIYRQFLKLVADARSSSVSEIHKIAQGRVWTGAKAQDLGLVDNLGSLQDVLDHAAETEGFKNYSVKKIKRELSARDQLLRTLLEQSTFDAFSLLESSNALGLALDLENRLLGHAQFAKDAELILDNTSMQPHLRAYARCLECVAP